MKNKNIYMKKLIAKFQEKFDQEVKSYHSNMDLLEKKIGKY